jgi:hypothetical protein
VATSAVATSPVASATRYARPSTAGTDAIARMASCRSSRAHLATRPARCRVHCGPGRERDVLAGLHKRYEQPHQTWLTTWSGRNVTLSRWPHDPEGLLSPGQQQLFAIMLTCSPVRDVEPVMRDPGKVQFVAGVPAWRRSGAGWRLPAVLLASLALLGACLLRGVDTTADPPPGAGAGGQAGFSSGSPQVVLTARNAGRVLLATRGDTRQVGRVGSGGLLLLLAGVCGLSLRPRRSRGWPLPRRSGQLPTPLVVVSSIRVRAPPHRPGSATPVGVG